MKLCALYIRVSTEKQARIEEGSLKTQSELINRHLELKNKLGQDQWTIVDRYVDEGKSAKDTKNRPAYLRMIGDIERGKINTVICTALSRISRSTRDLLDMIEFFKQKGVDFVCLKEDFDTTTAQGKCFITIMGALNEFEREQTSERVSASVLARAERGLWHGNQLFGYDLSKEKRGHLIPNEKEVPIVREAFETYLACGSVEQTCKILNAKGYRTKVFTSRYGKHHPGSPFCLNSLHAILTNHAYVGKKEIGKTWKSKPQEKLPPEKRYRVVPAVWPAIVPQEVFDETQKLLTLNCQHKHNGAKPNRHFYLLNGGALACKRCGSRMEGRSSHGKRGRKVYFYYICSNPACHFRLPEGEIEHTAQALVRRLAQDPAILDRIAEKANTVLRQELPRLLEEQRRLKRELEEVKGTADSILDRYKELAEAGDFVKEKLTTLSERRKQVEATLATLSRTIEEIQRMGVDQALIKGILEALDEVFSEGLKPYQRRELLAYVLKRIKVSDENLGIGVNIHSRPVLSPHHSTDPLSLSSSTRVTILESPTLAILWVSMPTKMLW